VQLISKDILKAYQGVLPSDAIEGRIRQEWESLRDIGATITSSYVTVAEPRAKKAAQISTSITIRAREDATTLCS
jgi:hypothetical protein